MNQKRENTFPGCSVAVTSTTVGRVGLLLCGCMSKEHQKAQPAVVLVSNISEDEASANSVGNLQKMPGNNPNLNLLNMNGYIKFGEILPICSKDI